MGRGQKSMINLRPNFDTRDEEQNIRTANNKNNANQIKIIPRILKTGKEDFRELFLFPVNNCFESQDLKLASELPEHVPCEKL